MTPNFESESAEERGFFQRFGFVLGIGAVFLVGAVIFVGQSFGKTGTMTHKMPEVTMVRLVPLPAPPPPPPPPPPPKLVEEKMVEQMPVDANESKPDDSAAPPSVDLGTNIAGAGGPDPFGLSGNRGGGLLGGSGVRGSAASRWGWYASQVQTSVSDALRKHARTRDANFRIEVRVWPDLTGRITRAQLTGSTGDAAVDTAIKEDVLAGLQLKEAPPEGMPLPIVMRLTARRPN